MSLDDELTQGMAVAATGWFYGAYDEPQAPRTLESFSGDGESMAETLWDSVVQEKLNELYRLIDEATRFGLTPDVVGRTGLPERTTFTGGSQQTWRQVGWIGGSGTFYRPQDHPETSEAHFSPVWAVVKDEPARNSIRELDTDCFTLGLTRLLADDGDAFHRVKQVLREAAETKKALREARKAQPS
jgi:hypothetical protein